MREKQRTVKRALAVLAAAGSTLALGIGLATASHATPSPSGISGVHIVTGHKTTVGLNSSAKGLAFCPSGEVAISGGVDSGTFTGQSVVTSRPAGAHDGQWLVRVYNDGNSLRFGNYFYPYAVCAPTASVPGFQVTWGHKTTVGLNSSAKGIAFCPAGKIAVSGGVDSGSFTGQAISTSRPAGAHNGQWLVRMYNDGNSLRFGNYFYPIVICANPSTGAHAQWGHKVWVSTPGGSPQGLAFCPTGEAAISGGVQTGSFSGQTVATSRPAGSHDGQWLVRMYNDGNSQRFANYFYPIVVCAPTA